MIKSGELENRQAGGENMRGEAAALEDVQRMKGKRAPRAEPGSDDEAPTLAKRIEAARQLQPQGRDLHCAECWTRGRDAALRVIEGREATS